jgi:hypothetical protein
MNTWFAVHAATFGEDAYVEMEEHAADDAEDCDNDFNAHKTATNDAFI